MPNVGGTVGRRRLSVLVPVLAGALLLGGCTASGPSAEEQAGAALEGFFEAVEGGDFATALAASTDPDAEFACAAFMEDGQPSPRISPIEVGSVQVADDGATASAEVTYTHDAEVTETVELERSGEEWKVVLPDSYRVAVEFAEPVVAEVEIEECAFPMEGTSTEVRVWPGMLQVAWTDPTGVVQGADQVRVLVPSVDAAIVPTAEFAGIDDSVVERLGLEASADLAQVVSDCVGAGFQGVACPVSLRQDAAASPFAFEDFSPDYRDFARVWTDDGSVWNFETVPGELYGVRDGAPATLPFTLTGTLDRADDGTLEVNVNP
ncbi:hypothetical protein [Herbiconiux liukaitaii]|uniref:hypothetical protein n=1 Tax=Herbiconiux liukaitaii TaxID=3342799 RepID=UPI0035B7BE85